MRIEEDEAMTARTPALRPARVTVFLTDGRSATHAVDSHRGDFNQPFTETEIREKFRSLAGEVLTEDGVAALETTIMNLDSRHAVRDLISSMKAHGRA